MQISRLFGIVYYLLEKKKLRGKSLPTVLKYRLEQYIAILRH